MKKEFVPYDIALALKELGFDEKCLGYYRKYHSEEKPNLGFNIIQNLKSNSDLKLYDKLQSGQGLFIGINEGGCSAPIYQQAFRWFRENTKLSFYCHESPQDGFRWVIENLYNTQYTQPFFDTYEEAELACLRKLIEIVKENL